MDSVRKIFAVIIFIILFQGILTAQTQKNDSTKSKLITEENSRATNSVYFELGGNCGLYSLNLEEELIKNINARIGFSIFDFDESSRSGSHNVSYFVTTFMANYFLEIYSAYYLELGAGIVYSGKEIGFTSTLGYRYGSLEGGMIFKIGLTPFVMDREIRFWGGIGLGYRF